MPFPLDDEALAGLTAGLEEVLVVEDKVAFLEGHVKRGALRRTVPPRAWSAAATTGAARC